MRSLSCRLGVLLAICLGAAAGSASAQPNLVIVKLHTNPFTQGQVGASYLIAVHNFGTGPTAGTVTVTDTLPAGLTATAFAGPGWTCTLTPLPCTSFPALRTPSPSGRPEACRDGRAGRRRDLSQSDAD